MCREMKLIHYNTAMAVYQGWYEKGAITAADLSKLESLLAEKYRLSLDSIYRRRPLLYLGL